MRDTALALLRFLRHRQLVVVETKGLSALATFAPSAGLIKQQTKKLCRVKETAITTVMVVTVTSV